ncbi:hypothetical protein GCM10010411_76520 [Actinomadura fulvescens]|uniref:Uncharacterized protein n=1 Tax=Actinomadura fulvescens TaxID=46160 RepID=A0ABN3QJA3_9ACTN
MAAATARARPRDTSALVRLVWPVAPLEQVREVMRSPEQVPTRQSARMGGRVFLRLAHVSINRYI